MNTELANNVIQAFGEPSFLVNNTHISFARQSKEDVVEIENMSEIEARENISTEELESWFEETESSFDESLYF